MTIGIKTILLIIVSIVLAILSVKLLKKTKIKIVLNIIIYILYLFIIVITAQKIIFHDNKVLNCYLFRVSSGSMANTLEVNDFILVKEMKTYKVGDIITYKLDNRTITHRIVNVEGDVIVTKGDANFNIDRSITKDKVIGKTIFHGLFLNLFVLYFSYMIIAYATAYLIADIFIKK